MPTTSFPLGSVGQAAFRDSNAIDDPPNATKKILASLSRPFRSSGSTLSFATLISSKSDLLVGVEAYEDPTEVEKLLMGYCERKRKAGESKEVVSKKLGEFEQEINSRHASSYASSPAWSHERLQAFATSVHNVRSTLSLPASTIF